VTVTRIRRWTHRRVAPAVAAAVLLAACSSGGDTGSTSSDSTTAPAATTEIDRNATVKVGMDLVQQGAGGFALDPTRTPSAVNDAVQYLIFGRLMRPTPDGGLEPDLASEVTVLDPGTIRVELRPGATFQDGAPFDAAAVKAGLDRSLQAANSGMSTAFFDLTAVQVVDSDTVDLTIRDGRAASWLDTFLGSWQTTIVKPDTDFSRPVGAGPMRVVASHPEQSMALERWDGFWDAGSVNFAGMELVHADATATQSGIAALRSGLVDIIHTDENQLAGLTGDLSYVAAPDPSQLVNAMMCKKDGPLADPRLRKAMNKAVDRDLLNEAVYQGTASPATEAWPEGHRFHDPAVADELAYDPEGARALMAEAGYPDGFSIDLYFLPYLSLPETAEVVQQQLADVGIDATLIPAPNFVDDYVTSGVAGAAVIPSVSPGRLRLNQWTGDSIGNVCDYQDDELDAAVAELATVGDSSDEAVEIWHDIEALVADQAPSLLMVFVSTLAAYDSSVFVAPPTIWPAGLVTPDVYRSGMRG
jgi:peptide/nickel transport system substrate-binding protein